MKKILFLALSAISLTLFAQNKMTISDPFDNGKFQWDEYFDKNKTAGIMDGYLILENETEGNAHAVADLPIDIERNFNIKIKFLIPKIKDDKYFGVVFDYEDENNYTKFVIAENKYKICNVKNGTMSVARQGVLILKSGKEKEVNFEINKKGTKLTFIIDNMDVVTFSRKLNSGIFGFTVEGSYKIMVDEITIEQFIQQ